jgi:hypothetical protein
MNWKKTQKAPQRNSSIYNEHIKGINGCVVYILQARDISERLHLISVYQVHVKLPYLFHLPKYKTKEGGERVKFWEH